LKINNNKINFQDGLKIARYTWVAKRQRKVRCQIAGLSAACPAICEVCSTCVDPPSQLRFRKFIKNGKYINRSCSWVTRESTPSRCLSTGNIYRKNLWLLLKDIK